MTKFNFISCRLVFGCLLTAILLVSQTNAQAVNGRVEGTVRDAAGAVVPGASVTVTRPQTGAERTATTNEEGVFTIPEVPSGTYNVRIGAPNFKTTNVASVIVEVGTPASLNVTCLARPRRRTFLCRAARSERER